MARICVELPDELEKQLRLKTIERFSGKKGYCTRAVEEESKPTSPPSSNNSILTLFRKKALGESQQALKT
jgi:hypothetical protein